MSIAVYDKGTIRVKKDLHLQHFFPRMQYSIVWLFFGFKSEPGLAMELVCDGDRR